MFISCQDQGQGSGQDGSRRGRSCNNPNFKCISLFHHHHCTFICYPYQYFLFLFVILIFHAWLVEMLLCNFLESWRWLQNDLDFFDDSEHQVGFWPNTSDLFPILRKTSSSYPSRLKSTLLIAINSLVKLSLLCKTFSFLVRFLNCHECLPEASGLGNLTISLPLSTTSTTFESNWH